MTTTSPALLDYAEAVERFDPVIGIEVHVELATAAKLFDDAPVAFGAAPNSMTTPASLGLPGALPVVNRKAVELAIRLGLGLRAEIAESCRFARKNYFYPDIPKNFQTSQFDEPIVFDGALDIELEDGTPVTIDIERAHLEEDAGKSTHLGGAGGRIHGAAASLVDYNRAGVPLVEIVTRPVLGTGMRAPEVARTYVKELRDLVRALGVSEARMERGNVRADVNVSLRADATAPMGTRTETKNLNSFRSIERAARFEIRRQAAVLLAGEQVVQETRHWHEALGETSSGRPKSDAEDYRYFPEPDLVPLTPSREWVGEIAASLPELPATRRRRLQEEWGYSDAEMRDVINAGAIELIEATVTAGAQPAAARKWWMGELARIAGEQSVELGELSITPSDIAELEVLIGNGRINDKIARQVLAGVLAGEGRPEAVVAARGLEVVSDDAALLEAIDAALAQQPEVVDKIRGGKVQAAGAIVGAVMKATQGQADASRVRELIMERIA